MMGRVGKSSTPSGAGRSLVWRADQLDEALVVGGDELASDDVAKAREIVTRVRERWALKGGRTVVALAGATGSGKSSLFNALVNDEVATIGARRPTTATATAAMWGEEDANPLLDWMEIGNRHHVGAPGHPGYDEHDEQLDGLVLIDLPDFDSRETAHRVEADRILERCDVFVWVTDPQKYADARLHEDYLASLRDHQSVMIVVLNQIDRLAHPAAARQIQLDLSRLAAADGAGEFEVLGTSALIGTGVDALRAQIGEVVAAHTAAEQRLTGDLVAASRSLMSAVAADEPPLTEDIAADLNRALAQAAGIPVVLQAVERDFLRQSKARAGWPFTRWVSGLKPSPLRRLRLGDESSTGVISAEDVRAVLGRSSLPPATPAARSSVKLATRSLSDAASVGLPTLWARAVDDAANPTEDTLADALDQAVINTPLRANDPFWWSIFRFVHLLLALCVLLGGAWLTALAVSGWLQIDLETPTWGVVPVPLALFAGGILAGILLAALARVLARSGAKRRRAAVEKRMDAAISVVAKKHVRGPVSAVLKRHQQTRQQLQAATSR